MKIIVILLAVFMFQFAAIADTFTEQSVYVEKPPYVQLEYSGDNITYKGYNYDYSASDAATDWVIFKYTYSGDNIIKIERRTGAWTGHAALF